MEEIKKNPEGGKEAGREWRVEEVKMGEGAGRGGGGKGMKEKGREGMGEVEISCDYQKGCTILRTPSIQQDDSFVQHQKAKVATLK